MPSSNRLVELIGKHQKTLLEGWVAEQLKAISKQGVLRPEELRDQCAEFLTSLIASLKKGKDGGFDSATFDDVKEGVASISRSRALQGFSPTETALFIFSLKKPLFALLQTNLTGSPEALVEETLSISTLLDQVGLYSTEVFQKTREEVILRQNQELLELSTPVVKLWDGVLALPLIGTLDSARTQVVMESLLQKIVETSADVAIIDITGVPTVDTLVAQHLLKTVTAARLMGAECILSGIRPQIAQTIVHLGINLGDVITKASLAEALKVAIDRSGLVVVKKSSIKA
ncbi:rsbT co-antagonist protein RsbR [Verrucomicrobium sp. GAS474]|uniref:STAS domain-containing protein n=1 Tax=Verrucomicrobium sp. GAS474 TaxID=1882831 RepID=UPI00087B8733|nr:STAS domain-containing protein [Verrucomicrobium sp. GAS474]SDU03127.1 rsbT co-antagonist protein RsbR [Verrucomicrobium sp. GAS474]